MRIGLPTISRPYGGKVWATGALMLRDRLVGSWQLYRGDSREKHIAWGLANKIDGLIW